MSVIVLAGDIGGTNTRLAILEGDRVLKQSSFVNAEFIDFEQCLTIFLSGLSVEIGAAAIGAAGPVANGKIEMTNLNWSLDQNELSKRLGIPVQLLNDFHIQALGVLGLTTAGYMSLGPARVLEPRQIAVVGAGTGLGEALLHRVGQRWTVIPGEGGHKRFAPKSEREIDLLRLLMKAYPEHVSIERLVSGPGIENIYEALVKLDGLSLPAKRTAREITEDAMANRCTICVEVLDLFVDTLADEAANLVLQARAECVYVSGGIPPRILSRIEERFRAAFEAKGRYRNFLQTVEIRMVMEHDIALQGAAYAAQDLLQPSID